MRNSYRRMFSLIVLLAILLTGAVTVGVAQDQVVIRFFHKWPEPAHVEYYQWVIDEFEAANPNIQIEMEAVADEPYKDKIRVVMASGDVPDIFFSWAGEFSWKFAREGRALPLDDAFFGTDWKDDVINSAAEPYRWEGVLYGLPMRINAKFMVYNKAIFDSVGLSAPTTWDEFLATCDALKEADIVPLAFGNEFPWASSHYVGDLNAKLVPGDAIQSDYLLTGESDTLFSHPGYVEALARFQELNNRGCFNEGANALQHSLARASFIAGRTGMIYVELEEFVTIAEGMGQDAFGFFQFPSGTGGDGDQNLLTGAPDGFMVSAETEHPEEALAFLRFLLSPERGAEYVRRLGIPSAVVGAVNDETALPVVVQGVEAINAASGMALWLDTDINIKIVEVYLPGMQALLTGSETPESLMEKVRAAAVAVQAELAQ
ncbi:MAG: extracellular solute-binding protein [Chloroflexi bacterium]|nr:extracellular solute-binding protein [Chloroflexota bacterium]